MSAIPISTSRISDSLKNVRLLSQLNADQVALQRSFEQLATGLRVSKVSDDPAAAGRAITLQRGIGRSEQLSRNARVTESFYSATDVALASVGDLLIQARGVTVEAAQNVLMAEERESLAATIDQAVRSAMTSANAIFRDHQLLTGHIDAKSALEFVSGKVVFSGGEAVGQTYIGAGPPVAIGVTGTEAFGLGGTIANSDALGAAVDRSTPLADLRLGRGISPGIIRLSDGGDWVEVDLRSASSVGDVVYSLEALSFSGRQLDVSLSPDGMSIQFADGLGGSLIIDDIPGGRTASDLAIRNVAGLGPVPVVATGLRPRITPATSIAQLAGGIGIDVSAGFQIRQGDQTFTVDLSSAQTVGDLIVAINRSGADVRAQVDAQGQGITIRGMASGVDYAIGENGGTVAGDLGLRTATGATRLGDLAKGFGPFTSSQGAEFEITRTDGSVLQIELGAAETVDDVMSLINNHPDNQDALKVTASLKTFGNGIVLTAVADTQPIAVRTLNSSNAANLLGLVPDGQTASTGTTGGTVSTLAGGDYSAQESGGTIDTLVRLAQAIRDGDIPEIGRLQQRLDGDRENVNSTRGRVGLWTQNLQKMRAEADDTAVMLKGQLSEEVDADMAKVITDISNRQASQEASLKMIAQTARLSLLDFL